MGLIMLQLANAQAIANVNVVEPRTDRLEIATNLEVLATCNQR